LLWSALGLALGSWVGFKFTSYIYYIYTKPTALSSNVTVTLQVTVE